MNDLHFLKKRNVTWVGKNKFYMDQEIDFLNSVYLIDRQIIISNLQQGSI